MRYAQDSLEHRLLAGEAEALGIVSRWIAIVLTSSSFWPLRQEWPDLHQEALTRVLASLTHERFDSRGDLRLYVQAIARYTAVRALRTAASESPRHGEPTEADPGPEIRARLLVSQVLIRMSSSCRELVTRYFLEQRSYEELAAELELPVGTIKSRLSRCLEAAHRIVGRHRPRKPLTAESREER